jgi:stearoyl-CoA desaturase (delta-9 desaturase)
MTASGRRRSPAEERLLSAIGRGGKAVRTKRIVNGILIGVPLLGSAWACVHFRDHAPAGIAVAQAIILYVVTGIGIGVGFHRLFSHRSFETYPAIRLAFGIAGSLAFQGSVVRWVADHRRHHRFTDEEPDTHTPHRYPAPAPWKEKVRDLWHAHVGWMFDDTTTDPKVYAPDLRGDRVAQFLTRWYWPLTFASVASPTVLGYALGGAENAIDSLLLAGCVRTTFLHNVIWAVNSIGHTWGARPSTEHNESRNNVFLAIVTFGEGWHNNHHAAPRAAYNNWRGREVDFNGGLIRVLARLGLIWSVVGRPRGGGSPVK